MYAYSTVTMWPSKHFVLFLSPCSLFLSPSLDRLMTQVPLGLIEATEVFGAKDKLLVLCRDARTFRWHRYDTMLQLCNSYMYMYMHVKFRRLWYRGFFWFLLLVHVGVPEQTLGWFPSMFVIGIKKPQLSWYNFIQYLNDCHVFAVLVIVVHYILWEATPYDIMAPLIMGIPAACC